MGDKSGFRKRLSVGPDRHRTVAITEPTLAPDKKGKDGEKKKDTRDKMRFGGGADSKRFSGISRMRFKRPKTVISGNHQREKNDVFYETTQKMGIDSTMIQVSNMYKTMMNIAVFFLHDDESTFWTLPINDETTAWEVCQRIEEKLHLKDNFHCFIRVFEREREMYGVDRLLDDTEVINDIRQRWKENDKAEKCNFVVRVIRVSMHPTRISQDNYDSDPKIISFLPDKVISRYLFSGGEPPTKPIREAFPAVVMFVDIAGFTSFTENLLKEGGDMGIEGLTMHLNQFFKKLIAVIKSHHGDVIQFGGDAILVIWHSPLHKLHVLATAACFCGVDIQSTLAGYQTSSGKQLSLYVAIAAGTMENIHVGSPGNWIIVFGGEPVSQLSRIMGFCAPGEVVLSVECYGALGSAQNDLKLSRKQSLDAKRQRRGFLGMFSGKAGREEDVPYQLHGLLPSLKKPSGLGISGSGKKLPKAVWGFLRGYLSADILDNIDSGLLSWMDGLRRVAIMFVNLPGLDNFSSPSFLKNMQFATEVLQSATKRWDGSINKYIMDDKGTLLLCAFGMPLNSSINSSYRATRAAMTISRTLKNQGIACTIGVTTDRTFIGLVGSDQRQECTIMGDAVNMAARLMKTAVDILVDQSTYNLTSKAFVYHELKDVKVKGKAKTFSAFRPVRARSFHQSEEEAAAELDLSTGGMSSEPMPNELNRGSSGELPALIKSRSPPHLEQENMETASAPVLPKASRKSKRKSLPSPGAIPIQKRKGSQEEEHLKPKIPGGRKKSLPAIHKHGKSPPRSPPANEIICEDERSSTPAAEPPESSDELFGKSPVTRQVSLLPPPSLPLLPSESPGTPPPPPISSAMSPLLLLNELKEDSFLVNSPRSGPLYGFDEVMDQILELLENIEPCGVVVNIRAPVGCGKTSFLKSLQSQCQPRIDGECFMIDGSPRHKILGNDDLSNLSICYGPLLDYLFDCPTTSSQFYEQILSEYGQSYACLFSPFMGATIPEGETSDISELFDEEDNTSLVHSAIAIKYQAKWPEKKVLLLDNAHLLSEMEWRLLAAFQAECTHLMIVFTSLTKEFPPEVRMRMKGLLNSNAFKEIFLPPLDDKILENLIAETLGVSFVDPTITEPLIQNSRGSIKELLSLTNTVKDLHLVYEENDVAVGKVEANIIQQFNNSLYIDWLDPLAPVLQVTLKVAAVAGKEVTISALQYVHPFSLSTRQVQTYIFRLYYAGFLTVEEPPLDQPAGDMTCTFVSERTRKWIYSSILYAHRQKIHHAYAVYYERMINEMDDLGKGLNLVASHWSKSQTPERAFPFLLEYGNLCLHSFDFNTATEVFDRIILVSEGKTSGAGTSSHPATGGVFFRTLCREKMAIALGIGGHLARCQEMLKGCAPEYGNSTASKGIELPWLTLRTFAEWRIPLLSNSRRLLFQILVKKKIKEEKGEGGIDEQATNVLKAFFCSACSLGSVGSKCEFSEDWENVVNAMTELRAVKRSALLGGAEQSIRLLYELTTNRNKTSQAAGPLLMATAGSTAQNKYESSTGVVEPHQQIEMYADACFAATVMGLLPEAEHFMALSHRQGNNVYDVYSYGYALIQSSFFTIPRGMWAISTHNLKLGITLLESCKRRVHRIIAVAQVNLVLMTILQGTLNKAIDLLKITFISIEDEEAHLLLLWCYAHIILMTNKEERCDDSLLDPFFKKPNTHFDFHTQLMWISLICKRSWQMGFFSRTIVSLLDAYNIVTKYDALTHCPYYMCYAICNILEVLFDVMEDPKSLIGIQSFISQNYDLRLIIETFLGALCTLSAIYVAFEPRFIYFKGRLSWGLGKDKKAMKRFTRGLEIAGKHQLLLDSALLNQAMGLRLADKSERKKILESAKNMLWICGAEAYERIDEETPRTPIAPPPKSKKGGKKKDEDNKYSQHSNVVGSLHGLFSQMEKEQDERVSIIARSPSLSDQDLELICPKPSAAFSDVFKKEEDKAEKKPTKHSSGSKDKLSGAKAALESSKSIEDGEKKKKKSILSSMRRDKHKEAKRPPSHIVEKEKAPLLAQIAEGAAAAQASRSSSAGGFSPTPATGEKSQKTTQITKGLSSEPIMPGAPSEQTQKRQDTIGAAFQVPVSSTPSLQKNISSPPESKIQKEKNLKKMRRAHSGSNRSNRPTSELFQNPEKGKETEEEVRGYCSTPPSSILSVSPPESSQLAKKPSPHHKLNRMSTQPSFSPSPSTPSSSPLSCSSSSLSPARKDSSSSSKDKKRKHKKLRESRDGSTSKQSNLSPGSTLEPPQPLKSPRTKSPIQQFFASPRKKVASPRPVPFNQKTHKTLSLGPTTKPFPKVSNNPSTPTTQSPDLEAMSARLPLPLSSRVEGDVVSPPPPSSSFSPLKGKIEEGKDEEIKEKEIQEKEEIRVKEIREKEKRALLVSLPPSLDRVERKKSAISDHVQDHHLLRSESSSETSGVMEGMSGMSGGRGRGRGGEGRGGGLPPLNLPTHQRSYSQPRSLEQRARQMDVVRERISRGRAGGARGGTQSFHLNSRPLPPLPVPALPNRNLSGPLPDPLSSTGERTIVVSEFGEPPPLVRDDNGPSFSDRIGSLEFQDDEKEGEEEGVEDVGEGGVVGGVGVEGDGEEGEREKMQEKEGEKENEEE